MSSHREAPEISKDPVADSTDTYAFVSPDAPNTVTIITNYIPLEDPAGGPNFFEFGDDVLYRINVDNDGDGRPDVIYDFRFKTTVTNPNTFLYNTGPIASLDSANFNRRQSYSVTEFRKNRLPKTLGDNLASPPCNVGARSTPSYGENLANKAIHRVSDGITVFAGQRLDGFFVDLGAVFDLAALRPFQNLHLISTPAAAGVNALRSFNVHTIAIQVPISRLTRSGNAPSDPMASDATIGVWASAFRQKAVVRNGGGGVAVGPWVQVSRLGNPLFNEVIVPMGRKDTWNASTPDHDADYAQHVARPELAKLLPVLYPGVFPNLACVRQGPSRPARDPADRHPRWHRSRLPELHRDDPGRHAATERRDQAVGQPERKRHPRRRPCRIPERPARVRRHRDDRAARSRRSHDPARRQDVHA